MLIKILVFVEEIRSEFWGQKLEFWEEYSETWVVINEVSLGVLNGYYRILCHFSA